MRQLKGETQEHSSVPSWFGSQGAMCRGEGGLPVAVLMVPDEGEAAGPFLQTLAYASAG